VLSLFSSETYVMTTRLYYTESRLTGTSVIRTLLNGDTNAVILAETLFHPQGGGQKADVGFIGKAHVLHVVNREDGEVIHYVDSLDSLSVGDGVPLQVDPAHRRLSSRLHTAGHLLAAASEALVPSLKGRAGHHWPGEARVDFEIGGPEPDESFEAQLKGELSRLISLDLPVYATSPNSPPRLIQIGEYRPIPCGGTHVESLGAIESIEIRKVKKSKGLLRISYEVSTSTAIEYDPYRY
jgi:alanyl-tRNA synthetase